MELIIKKYPDLTKIELEQIHNLILKGGEVSSITLLQRLSESSLFAFVVDNNIVVATATIKNPLDNYKTNVFAKSKSNLSIIDYPFELGYIMVEESYRKDKLASQLCSELCKAFLKQKLFATTRIDNTPMQSILRKNYFVEIGEQYLNKNKTAFLKLFIKQEQNNTPQIS